MLKELKFVQGAVAKKDFIPSLTHFRIEGGRVRSFNGVLALSSPIPFNVDCTPKAEPLIRAIGNCEQTATMVMTDKGKLKIESGKFRAFIECVDGDGVHIEPEGEHVQLDGQALLNAFKVLLPFTGDDASRPWTNGVLIRGQSAYATNNVCLVEYWTGIEAPITVNIPRDAIREMVRIDEPPTHAQLTDNSITFHFADSRWVRTQLYETEWPDVYRILDQPSNPIELDVRLFEGVEVIAGFTDSIGRIYINDGVMRSSPDANVGAEYTIDGLQVTGIYQAKMLELLNGVATKADFTRYPQPALFFGDRLRGAIAGMTS